MPIKEPSELALIGQPAVLAVTLTEASAIAPIDKVLEAEKELAALVVDSDESAREATRLAGMFSGWASRTESYWKTHSGFHWARYKLFGRASSEGVISGVTEIAGTDRLGRQKQIAESKNRDYLKQKKVDLEARQRRITEAVRQDTQSLSRKIQQAADNGDMATARELIRERDMNAQAPVILAPPTDIGGAAVGDTLSWAIIPDTGLMDLVKAIATGTVPLYREVTVKGIKEMRSVLVANDVVFNQATRAMGKELHWPGVLITDDISIRTRKI